MISAQPDERKETWPDVLPGFGHVLRFWDRAHNICSAKILPGEYYVTSNDESITTVLGSCVSACVRDPFTGVGGMNHFMLPGESRDQTTPGKIDPVLATRYGIAAMESMINDILKLGARKSQLELKLFGGGKVLAMEVNRIGERNIEFVREFVKTEGLDAVSEDLGGPHPRKVIYFPRTGRVLMKKLRGLQSKVIADRERSYEKSVTQKPVTAKIELF